MGDAQISWTPNGWDFRKSSAVLSLLHPGPLPGLGGSQAAEHSAEEWAALGVGTVLWVILQTGEPEVMVMTQFSPQRSIRGLDV